MKWPKPLPPARRLNERLPGRRWLSARTGPIAIVSVVDFETLEAAWPVLVGVCFACT
jgi:hypothetical protein